MACSDVAYEYLANVSFVNAYKVLIYETACITRNYTHSELMAQKMIHQIMRTLPFFPLHETQTIKAKISIKGAASPNLQINKEIKAIVFIPFQP